uniref:Uncharacterized protein n=1 Tax=Dictyoglomus thermophilum TaxID=14 RepID=A0A7C2GWJ6_DICTH
MKKRSFLTFFLFLSFIFLILLQATLAQSSRSWSLSDKEIKDALDTAKRYRNDLYTIVRDYILFYGSPYEPNIVIFTPYLGLVINVREYYRKYMEPTKDYIENTLKLYEERLFIAAQIYGDRIDFAKDYHCVIKIGEKIVQPIENESLKKDVAELTDKWPYSPAYKATNLYVFPTSEILRDAKVEIILIGDEEYIFKADLSKLK